MKTIKKGIRAAAFAAAGWLLLGCSDFLGGASGELAWRFDRDVYVWTKAAGEIPDTNAFQLEVTDAKGKVLYSGLYGQSPDVLQVGAGSYTVSVRSSEFSKPAFASPQYGDTQVVVVRAGERSSARLSCGMLNAGIRLQIHPNFLTTYPNGSLHLRSGEGRLLYAYTEKRIAYFLPGSVSLLLSNAGKDEVLFSRNLSARQILTLGISAPGGDPDEEGVSFSVSVDTTTTRTYETYVIGEGGSGGETPDEALDVGAAFEAVGKTEAWVYGYIVGGDLSSAGGSVKTEAPFSKKTHLAIASRASTTAKGSCIAVELPAGKLRDALNLVDHPENIGRTVYVKGDIVQAYFNTTGIKNTRDYQLP